MTQPTNDDLRRELRGGSCYHAGSSGVRSSARNFIAPAMRSGYVGFRTALTGRLPR